MNEELINEVMALPSNERKELMDAIRKSLEEEGYFTTSLQRWVDYLLRTAASVLKIEWPDNSRRDESVYCRTMVAYQLRSEGMSINRVADCIGRHHATVLHMINGMEDIIANPRIFKTEYAQYQQFKSIINETHERTV